MAINIQYGNMNPLAGITQSVATGLQLGSMSGQRQSRESQQTQGPVIPVPERKTVQPSDILQQEANDLSIAEDYYKQIKGASEKDKTEIFSTLADEKIGSPLVKEMLKNNIKLEEINPIFQKIKTGNFSQTDIKVLKSKFGGDNSTGARIIDQKIDQARKMQTQYDQEYSNSLKGVVQDIQKIKEGMFEGKVKNFAPEVEQTIRSQYSMLSEIAKVDPQWVKDFINKDRAAHNRALEQIKAKGATQVRVARARQEPVKGNERLKYINSIQSFYKTIKDDENLAKQTLKIRNLLLQNEGDITSEERDQIIYILNKEPKRSRLKRLFDTLWYGDDKEKNAKNPVSGKSLQEIYNF